MVKIFHNSRYSLKLIIVLTFISTKRKERTKFSFRVINRTFYKLPTMPCQALFFFSSPYQNRRSMKQFCLYLQKCTNIKVFTHTIFFFQIRKKRRMWRKGILSSFLVSSGRLLITLGHISYGIYPRQDEVWVLCQVSQMLFQLFQIFVFFPLLYFHSLSWMQLPR